VRWAIQEAARRLGGIERLVEWAMEDPVNERLFWNSIWPRTLPLTIAGQVHAEVDLNVSIKPEELPKYLADHNLPLSVFGDDRWPIEPPHLINSSPPAEPAANAREAAAQTTVGGHGDQRSDPPPTNTPEAADAAADDAAAARRFLEDRMSAHVLRTAGRRC
jgi:hypothetical protein